MTVLFLQIHVCHGNGCLKEFPKNIVMFVRQLIEQTKVHFKILELLVITFGTRHYYNPCCTSALNVSAVGVL